MTPRLPPSRRVSLPPLFRADATARAEATAVLRAQERIAAGIDNGIMQVAAAQADQAADARRRPAVLAIADGAVHDVVDAGSEFPTADFARALDRVSMHGTAAILDGRGVAN